MRQQRVFPPSRPKVPNPFPLKDAADVNKVVDVRPQRMTFLSGFLPPSSNIARQLDVVSPTVAWFIQKRRDPKNHIHERDYDNNYGIRGPTQCMGRRKGEWGDGMEISPPARGGDAVWTADLIDGQQLWSLKYRQTGKQALWWLYWRVRFVTSLHNISEGGRLVRLVGTSRLLDRDRHRLGGCLLQCFAFLFACLLYVQNRTATELNWRCRWNMDNAPYCYPVLRPPCSDYTCPLLEWEFSA